MGVVKINVDDSLNGDSGFSLGDKVLLAHKKWPFII